MTDHPDPYQHSTRADLVNLIGDKDRAIKALKLRNQAQGEQLTDLIDKVRDLGLVIQALRAENGHLQEDTDRYKREARDGARVVGGILRVLRDNNIGWDWRCRDTSNTE